RVVLVLHRAGGSGGGVPGLHVRYGVGEVSRPTTGNFTHTVSDVEYQDYTSDTVWVKFPVVGRDFDKDGNVVPASGWLKEACVVIWTTTPWTIPGNRAVSYSRKIAYARITTRKVDRRLPVTAADLTSEEVEQARLDGVSLQERVDSINAILAEQKLVHDRLGSVTFILADRLYPSFRRELARQWKLPELSTRAFEYEPIPVELLETLVCAHPLKGVGGD